MLGVVGTAVLVSQYQHPNHTLSMACDLSLPSTFTPCYGPHARTLTHKAKLNRTIGYLLAVIHFHSQLHTSFIALYRYYGNTLLAPHPSRPETNAFVHEHSPFFHL